MLVEHEKGLDADLLGRAMAMARTIMDEVLGEGSDLIEHQLAHAVKDPMGEPTTAQPTCR